VRFYLYSAAFLVGASIMAAELAASRLMAPYYGTSTPVWALIIGAVLCSIALGSFLGGRIASRFRGRGPLAWLLVGSALLLAGLPVAARPILQASVALLDRGAVGGTLATALGVNALLAVPLLVLGMAGPLLLNTALRGGAEPGRVTGDIYCLGTVGSLVGTWLGGLVMVPALGPRLTLWSWAAVLGALGLGGALRGRGRVLALACLAAAVGILLQYGGAQPARAGAILVEETAYNHLEVVQRGDRRELYLNDGHAVQSLHLLNGELPLFDVWAWYAAAPAFTAHGAPREILLLGLGGGTSARILRQLYPAARITGVELDPQVVEAGRAHMGLPDDVQVEIADARRFVADAERLYDIIVVDAFQFPYVPFQLCTAEFMRALHAHLAPGGAVMLNIGRDGEAREVVHAVARTLASVFPQVRGADVDNRSNTVLVGTRHHPAQDAGLAALPLRDGLRKRLARRCAGLRPWEIPTDAPLLTDEVAPVELLTDRIVLRRLLESLGLGGAV